ncbi:MAG TPA: NADH-quinone oxidoreductase subunit NuoK [Candidatus Omnitrophota bacterium]|nr:NADH-quinone oxidoreductase subunit NuoK [Candidatus Omnitrophota bacterium]
MTPIPLNHFVIFSLFLFSIGLYGTLTRRNVIGILMGIELMLNAANINLIAFSRYISPNPETGQIFVIFVIVLAACAAAVGLAIVLAMYQNRKTVQAEDIHILKW